MKILRRIIEFLFVRKHSDTVYYIHTAEGLPQPLSKEEEKEALLKWEKGEVAARNLLIEHNLRLVVYIAKRYEANPMLMEDLISIGSIGLIKAVNTFKMDKNIKLVTYASRCIENEILMYLRKKSKYKKEVSLDEPLNVDGDGNELLLSDIIGTDDDVVPAEFEKNENKRELMKALTTLKQRERMILMMRYGIEQDECTQKDIAEKLGISQSYISRLEKKIIAQLQGVMKSSQS